MNDKGKVFYIRTEDGYAKMRCIEHTADTRYFEEIDGSGYLELDWMEFMDQKAIGRISEMG